MTLTHAQLMDAVRAAGRDRESFTCADVRQQLGLSTADRVQMNRFYKRFSALQKSAAGEIEKLGNNCYRLRVSEAPVEVVVAAPVAPVVAAPVAPVVEAAVKAPVAPFVEAPAVEALVAPVVGAPVVAALVSPVEEAQIVEAQLVEAPVDAPLVAALIAEIPDGEPFVEPAPVQRLELVEALPKAEQGPQSQPAVAPAGKRRRAPWLSRMASFFSRRSNKSDVDVAVGA